MSKATREVKATGLIGNVTGSGNGPEIVGPVTIGPEIVGPEIVGPVTVGPVTIGLVTIGHAQRDDLFAEIIAHLPAGTAIRSTGALDPLDAAQLEHLLSGAAPQQPADGTAGQLLTTRLRNGEVVEFSRYQVVPLLQDALDRLHASGVEIVALLCSEPFPELLFDGLLIEPGLVLEQLVRALAPKRLGVMVPLASQVPAARQQWQQVVPDLVVTHASPYGENETIVRAAGGLREHNPGLVVMDCLGFNTEHKRLAAGQLRCPVLQPLGLLGRLLGELV